MIDLDMSPYAAFVWPAWGLTALILGGLVARAAVVARRRRQELASLEADKAGDEA